MSNKLTKLPEGWSRTKLGDCMTLINGRAYLRHELLDQGTPIIRIQNLNGSSQWFYSDLKLPDEKYCEKGDLLFAWSTTFGPFIWQGSRSIYHYHIWKIEPSEAVDKKFAFYLLKEITEEVKAAAHGVAMLHITKQEMENWHINLPPVNEQKRIANKMEELCDRHQRAKQAIEAIPKLYNYFRQTILAAAFRGDLTADWRAENLDIEPALFLLERIRCDRQQSSSKQKVDLEAIDISSLPKLPETWEWEKLANICTLLRGVTKGRRFNGQSTVQVPYLRVANVQDGFLALDEIKEIEILSSDVEKYSLEHGDILFTAGGDRDKLGRGTVWNDEIKGCIHQNHIYRARLYSSALLPEYISLAAKTENAKDYFFTNASHTVNLASIKITSLGNLPLPIPPLEEQKEICRMVYKLFQITDSIKTHHQTVLSQLDHLNKSILAKAFCGELVQQDFRDEPVSALLERIQAEHEKANNSKRTKGRQFKQLKLEV